MRFACESCLTRYTLPDEKVRDRVLKIRCKNCSAIMVVKDPALAQQQERQQGESFADEATRTLSVADAMRLAQQAGASAFDQVGGAAAPTDEPTRSMPVAEAERLARTQLGAGGPVPSIEWFVMISGEQHGPLSQIQLQRRIDAGEVGPRNYVWCEGMADWQRLHTVEQLAALLPDAGAIEPQGPTPGPGAIPAGQRVLGTAGSSDPTPGPQVLYGGAATPGPQVLHGGDRTPGPQVLHGGAATPGPQVLHGSDRTPGPQVLHGGDRTPGPQVLHGGDRTPGPQAAADTHAGAAGQGGRTTGTQAPAGWTLGAGTPGPRSGASAAGAATPGHVETGEPGGDGLANLFDELPPPADEPEAVGPVVSNRQAAPQVVPQPLPAPAAPASQPLRLAKLVGAGVLLAGLFAAGTYLFLPSPPPADEPAAAAPGAAKEPVAATGSGPVRLVDPALPSGSPLDAAAVRDALATRLAGYERCVADHTGSGSRSGRVVVRAVIAPTGVVTTASVTEGGGGDLGVCLADRTRDIRFPAFEGEPLELSVPIDVRVR